MYLHIVSALKTAQLEPGLQRRVLGALRRLRAVDLHQDPGSAWYLPVAGSPYAIPMVLECESQHLPENHPVFVGYLKKKQLFFENMGYDIAGEWSHFSHREDGNPWKSKGKSIFR